MSKITQHGNGSFGKFRVLQLSTDLVPHAHPEAQLVFSLDQPTDDLMLVAGMQLKLNYRHAVFANPMEKHSHRLQSTSCQVLVFYFENAWLIDFFGLPNDDNRFLMNQIHVSESLRRTVDCFVSLSGSLKSCDETDFWVEKIANQLQDFSVTSKNKIEDSSVDFDKENIQKALEYMQKNLLGHRDIDLMAKAIGVSRSQLFKLFRFRMKTTPNVCWNAMRMEYAKIQLSSLDRSINEVASELGFSESANFSRFFKDHAGFNPSHYQLASNPKLV